MNIDHFFTIGSKHFFDAIPCEDYATSKSEKGMAFGIVSDGCSGAMARNDLASRAWSMAAERVVLNDLNYSSSDLIPDNFNKLLIDSFESHLFTNTIRDELASTLVMLANQDFLDCWIMGDGGVVVKHFNGDITVYEIKWENNKPFYPVYATDVLLTENFKNEMSPLPVLINKTRFEIVNSKIIIKSFDNKMFPFPAFEKGFKLSFSRIKDNIESVSLVTDGLWTFKENAFKVISNIVDFRDIKGQFLKTKMKDEQEKWLIDFSNNLPKDDFAITTLLW